MTRAAIVTGSDSGIGKATAVALAESGFDVGVTWHEDEVGAKGTAAEVASWGRRAVFRRLDVTDLPGAGDVIDELAEHGITVNSVAPGEISTPMTGQADLDPTTQDRPGIPVGRPGHAREIAHWVVALAAPDARYATGASFVVDGGMLLMAAAANRG